jgi:small acid-soluble spore protein F (minor alpha/beta-type SASP)
VRFLHLRILSLFRYEREATQMARRMSEALKVDLARELGVYETVRRHGWGEVPARKCGELVRLAIRRAERALR